MKRLKDLPVGALVKDLGTTYNGTPIIWRILEHNHDGDPKGSTTLESRDVLTLKAFDAKEPNSSGHSKSDGNNRYDYSNILQWLNSDAPANEWFVKQHSNDQSPDSTSVVSVNPYADEAGFLTNFSDFLKKNLMLTSKGFNTSIERDTSQSSLITTTTKIFLLSYIEVRASGYESEGTTYSYYLDDRNDYRQKNLRDEAAKGNYTSSSCIVGSPYEWLLRTGIYYEKIGSSYYGKNYICTISKNGYLVGNGVYAYTGYHGVAPALNVPCTMLVSDKKDTDGCYIIRYRLLDKIILDSDSENFGSRVSGFDVGYKITDLEQGQYSAIVELDGTQVDSISDVVLGQHYTYEVTTSALNQLSMGEHTIIITITSNEGDTESKTITFNHVTDELLLTGSDEDLGNVWHKSQLTYQVRGVEDKSITVTESLDGTQVRSFEATLDTDIVFDDTGWKDIGDEASHTAVITATNEDDVTVTRTWTFTKLMDELCFYTKPKATLNPATKINVVVGYEKDGNPTLKVEVTNNALAGYPIWEDASAAVNAGKAYEFVNIPNNSAEYGVSVKVTIMKSAETERVYAHYVGYSYA